MTPSARIINDLFLVGLDAADQAAYTALRQKIPGWSTPLHQLFFKAVLNELFRWDSHSSLCICGVYHGLDLALIADLAARHHPRHTFRLTGVDLFSSAPCDDWPADKRHLTWQEAFNCPPPSIEAARAACPTAKIVIARSADYLRTHTNMHQFVYLDTSHDELTLHSELEQCLAHGPRILAGDDYTSGSAGFECGVAKALDALLPDHQPIANRLWIA